MSPVRNVLLNVQSRHRTQWSWDCASWGLVGGGIAGASLAAANLLEWTSVPSPWIIGSVFTGPLVGFAVAWCHGCSLQQAASAIDRRCSLKDRMTTALGFLALGDAATSLQRLQIEDAESHASKVDPVQVAPVRAPRSLFWGMLCATGALALGLMSLSGEPIGLATGPNEVLISQVSRVDRELEELRHLQSEQEDPEIEKLLQDLNAKLEELKEPNVDPKEALAKLSEMEAAIQKMQKELNEEQSEASLKEIGEALALSESMASAAKAMSKGEMEKAAEELKKMEMPELDRKTEKAVTEKLETFAKNEGNGKQTKLKQAAEKMSAGLCKGDASKFKEGTEGLASECKKQGNRKKLSDLLRKQCQCLGECKSECESECNSAAQSKKKGGKKAGNVASGNEAGDKTTMLAADNKMNITGQESDQGEVDIETEKAPEKEQQAVRQYRENSEKYEALKESALESESIPLGHRQTIRKYFEMIRPEGNGE